VHTESGDVNCRLDDRSPKLGEFHIGDRVKLSCGEGVLTSIAKLEAPAEVQTSSAR
jgi:hypothetical protein